jgi:serine O-acetyltransferase
MNKDFKTKLIKKHQNCGDCPSNNEIKNLFEDCMSLLFPDFSDQKLSSLDLINQKIKSIQSSIQNILTHHSSLSSAAPSTVATKFISSLEKIESMINMDVEAIYKGDPAAKSREEIVRSYPGFYAIAAYRIAHLLHRLGVKVVPRIITELAHHRTGIDIHPAAQIDHSFCIDHGTGVVIGETTIIGHNVKIYQGVTLGALSVDKTDSKKKRHPTIEHNTVIYANATILGGDTIIGHHSTIGGNSWITKSVEPNSTIYYISENSQIKKIKN